MNPRTTGLLLLAALGLGAFLWFYEIGGEAGRLEAEQANKRLFPHVEANDVTWIALRTSDGADARFELHDGKWRIVAPLAFPADPAVGRMAEALATVTSEATYESPQPDAEYGLADEAKVVRFGGADGVEHVLRIGKNTPVGANVYVRADGGAPVHTVANYRTAALTRTLADLRDKQIASFDPSAIHGVEASWPGARVALTREAKPDAPKAKPEGEEAAKAADDWQMTEPLATRGDGEAMDVLLSTVSFLRADGFVDAPTPAQRALFTPPDYEVTLRGAGAQAAPITVAISRPDQGDKRLVRAAGDVLYQIPAARISDFPRKVAAYRERHVAAFAATDAKQVDFFFHAQGGDPVAIRAEHTDAGWSSTPEPFAPEQLASVVSELSRLDADDILAESMSEKELEKVGLSPPNTIITVLGPAPSAPAGEKKDDAKTETKGEEGGEPLPPAAPRLAEVHLGQVTPEGVVARAAGSSIVYRLAHDTAERLPVNLEAFESHFRAPPPAPAPAEAPGVPGIVPPAPAEDSP
jgi:uncharacterized protein DUF4340